MTYYANPEVISGGPYAHEIDAIRDERHRASIMGEKPDFHNVFQGAISPGAVAVIEDIGKPIDLPVGEFIENVVFSDEEEETSEGDSEEEESSEDESGTEDTSYEDSVSESGDAEGTSPVDDSDTPLFDELENA
jgi:hypothetical protein